MESGELQMEKAKIDVCEICRSELAGLRIYQDLPFDEISRLLLVSLITFVGYTVSNLVYIVSVTLINNWKNMVPQHISLQMAAEAVPGILLEGVLLCGISLLALPFGMRKKSVSQTIVAASIISMVLNGGFGDNVNGRLYSIAAVPVLLCLVGIAAAVYTCRRICRKDV